MHEYLIRRNSVFAALDAQRRDIHKLWVQDGIDRKAVEPILNLAARQKIPVEKTSKQALSNLAQDGRHQGVLLETGPFVYSPLDDLLARAVEQGEKPLFLMLDLLHGPQNIGSLLRTAEVCGVHGVIVQDRRAPDITPSVVQYSAGAAEYLLVNQATNLAQTINTLQERDIWVAGLDLDEDAQVFGSLDINLPLALVVGHEGSGLRRIIKKNCDFLIRLPMRGKTESLNASITGSILLYAAWEARGFITTSANDVS